MRLRLYVILTAASVAVLLPVTHSSVPELRSTTGVSLASESGDPDVQFLELEAAPLAPDDVYWQSLGSGMSASVLALTVFNNQLIAGGTFLTASGIPASRVAAWDGASWSALGLGVSGTVRAMTVYGGQLIVGGSFASAGGTPAASIAAWNGVSWSALGSGLDSSVHALTVFDGKLIAGGYFTSAGGAPAASVAAWNGSSWSPLGTGTDGSILALTVFDSRLIAGGSFTVAGDTAAISIAAWDGALWSALGAGRPDGVEAMTVFSNELITGASSGGYGTWDGADWSGIPYIGGQFRALGVFRDQLIAGGFFDGSKTVIALTGLSWRGLGSGTNFFVFALAEFDRKLIVGGQFTSAGGSPAAYIAAWTKIPHIPATSLANSGPGSLRDAIAVANSDPGPDTIRFSVAGTIQLESPLPALSDAAGGTGILGFTAPGASAPFSPTVILDGSLSTPGPGLELATSGNRIEGLTLRNFSGPGVAVTGPLSLGNTITACRLYKNTGPGIDLGNDGITPNDPGDVDGGPNAQLNYPVFDSIIESGPDTFTVHGRAWVSSLVEVFLATETGNPARQPEATLHGPAHVLLGSAITAGDGSFSVPGIAQSEWSQVTATATDPAGNTSELALNRSLTPDPLRFTAYSEPVPPKHGLASLPLTSPAIQVVVISPPNSLGRVDTIGPPPAWPNTFGSRATYDSTTDLNTGGLVDTRVRINSPDSGGYRIKFILIGNPGDYLTGIGIDGHAEVQSHVAFGIPGQVDSVTFYLSPPIRGELTGDGVIDVFDIIEAIDVVFGGKPMPDPPEKVDVNCDGLADVFDVIGLIDYTFGGGTQPCQ